MISRTVFPILLASLLELTVSTSVPRSEVTAGTAAKLGIPPRAAPTPSLRGRSSGADVSLATSGGVVRRALSSAASDGVENTGSFIDFIDRTEPQSSSGLLSDTDDDDDGDDDSDSSSTTVLAGALLAAFLLTALGGFYWYVRKSGGRGKNNPNDGRPKEQQHPAGGAGGSLGESVSGPRAVKSSKSLRRFFMTGPSAISPPPCRTPTVSEGARACPPTPAILGAVGSDFLATGAVYPSRRVRRPRSARSSKKSGSGDMFGGQRTAKNRRGDGGRESARRSGREPGPEVSGDSVLGRRHPRRGGSEKTLSASSSTLQTSFASSASSSSFSSSFSSSSSSFSEASEPPPEQQQQQQQHGRSAARRSSGDLGDPDCRPDSPLPREPRVVQGGRDRYGRATNGARGPPRQEPELNSLGLARKFYAPPSSPTPARRKHSFSGQSSAPHGRVRSPERTNADIVA